MVCTGWGMGETHLGAYAEKARVKGDWLVRLPDGHVGPRGDGDRHRRLHRHARGAGAGEARPDPEGRVRWSSPAPPAASARSRPPCWPSSAITSSPRPAGCRKRRYLKDLGAAEVIDRNELCGPGQAAGQGALGGRRGQRRLDHARQSAVDDQVWRGDRGLRPCRRHGPAVLGRAVYFARGVPSRHRFGDVPAIVARKVAWERLARDLDRTKLSEITHEIGLDQVIGAGAANPRRPGPRPHRGKNCLTMFRLYQPSCSNVATVGMVSSG